MHGGLCWQHLIAVDGYLSINANDTANEAEREMVNKLLKETL